MKTLAEWLVRRPVAWAILAVVAVVTGVSAFYASRVVQDDDVLAFLPRNNPAVATFYEVSDRYGSLDVALVGIASDDVFSGDFVDRLQRATKRLNQTDGIELALSMTSVEDFTPDPERGGISSDYLIREVPGTPAEVAALREKVMSRDHVVSNLVSADGKAVMLYCFAAPGAQPRVTAQKVRSVIDELFPSETKYWNGSPFIATYIYDATQADLKRLAPWACIAITLVILLSFRDLVGVGLSLLSTIIGILIPLGVMGAMGIHTNIVLGSMPVILFALGSAYGIHLMSRFYAFLPGSTREVALRRALTEVGPAVLGSGITTVFGLLSFVMMDIKPLRTFGLFTAFGLLVALVLALVFLPVVVTLTPVRGSEQKPFPFVDRWTAALSVLVMRHKRASYLALGACSLVALFFVGRVDSRLDTTAFFDPGSPPARAETFMRERFGGATFLQVEITGDMTEPVVLREVQHLADRISAVPGVASVTQIADIVAMTNEAMEDVRRVPDTPEKVKLLYGFLTGKRAVASTVTEDRRGALLQVKVGPSSAREVEIVLDAVEGIVKELVPAGYAVEPATAPEAKRRRTTLMRDRIVGLGARFGSPVTDEAAVFTALDGARPAPPEGEVASKIAAFVRTEAFGVPLPKGDRVAEDLAASVVALGTPPRGDADLKAYKGKFPEAVAKALGKPAEDPAVDDASLALEQSVVDAWSAAGATAFAAEVIRVSGMNVPEGAKGARLRRAVADALLDMDAPTVLVPRADGGGKLEARVTGTPVLYRGLSKSVFDNQWNSLWFALLLVIVLKAIIFRSILAGVLSSVPTLLTLLIIYGVMGAFGVHLDIGTSMLASLIIGAGDDYAVEYLWAWFAPPGSSLEQAARTATLGTAAGIWTNAITMAIGFFVLTLGEARPLKNVGGLTASAMLVAAITTFIVCPLLARRRSYAPGAAAAAAASEAEVDVAGSSKEA